MHFSLVMVGAHDGSKTEQFVRAAAGAGEVLLIEPVPFLFNRLAARYSALPNVRLRNFAISTEEREIDFTAPKETANLISLWRPTRESEPRSCDRPPSQFFAAC